MPCCRDQSISSGPESTVAAASKRPNGQADLRRRAGAKHEGALGGDQRKASSSDTADDADEQFSTSSGLAGVWSAVWLRGSLSEEEDR